MPPVHQEYTLPGSPPDPIANSLIAGLPRQEQRRLLAACEPTELAFGVTLFRPGEPLREAIFPLSACVSLAASVAGHPPLDMVLVGSEGMLGLSLALGSGHDVPMLGIVKCPGTALRLPAAWLRQELPNSPGLARAMQRHLRRIPGRDRQQRALDHVARGQLIARLGKATRHNLRRLRHARCPAQPQPARGAILFHQRLDPVWQRHGGGRRAHVEEAQLDRGHALRIGRTDSADQRLDRRLRPQHCRAKRGAGNQQQMGARAAGACEKAIDAPS